MRIIAYQCDGCGFENAPTRSIPKRWLFQKPNHFCPTCIARGIPGAVMAEEERERRAREISQESYDWDEAHRKWEDDIHRRHREWLQVAELKRKNREAMARGEEPPGPPPPPRPGRVISQKTLDRMAAQLEERGLQRRWGLKPLDTNSGG